MAASDRPIVRIGSLADRITDDVRMAMLSRAAHAVVGIIRRRTALGLDVEGATFKAYSPAYAVKRAKSGRNVTPPDLTLGGDMLAGMTVLSVTPEVALVGFQGSSTPYAFLRFRTPKGKATTKRAGDGVRLAFRLVRSATRKPVSNAVKAKAHNEGTGRVPRRHFFGISDEERREVIAEAMSALKLTK